MKFDVILFFSLFVLYNTSAQSLYIKGDVDIKASAAIYVNGGVAGNGSGQITNNGDIHVTVGDWDNDAATSFLDGTGNVTFSSSLVQNINGTFATSFYNLTTTNSSIGIRLYSNISVANTMQMTDGDFDLKANVVDLGTTGILVGETTNNRIKATDGAHADGQGTGTIIATRTNPNGNVAGLGLSMNLTGANITITRGHLVQSGTGTFSANASVFRYYKVSPVPNAGGGTNVTFNDCYTPELNGHSPTDLIMYQWMEESNSGVEYWHPLPDNTTGASVPITQTLDLATLNYIKVTLGSLIISLPIKLTKFTVECINNAVEINWQTSSELNNDYFTIEKSYDGVNFNPLEKINGAGNSNQTLDYSYIDYSIDDKKVVYYRLKQTDFNQTTSVSNILAVRNCSSEESIFEIQIYPNPAKEKFNIKIKGKALIKVDLSITDILGKEVLKQNIELNAEYIEESIYTNRLPTGIYVLRLLDKETKEIIITQKLIINK